MHCSQSHLTTSRVKSVKYFPEMTHGLLLGGQGIYQRLTGDKVLGAKLSEVATGVRETSWDAGNRAKYIGPVNGRGSDENLKQ